MDGNITAILSVIIASMIIVVGVGCVDAQEVCENYNQDMWRTRDTAHRNILTFNGLADFPDEPVILRNDPKPDKLYSWVLVYPLKKPLLLRGFTCSAEYDSEHDRGAGATTIVCDSTQTSRSLESLKLFLSSCLVEDGFEMTKYTHSYVFEKEEDTSSGHNEYKISVGGYGDAISLEYSYKYWNLGF
ncbi:MAG: hypothetical protein R3C52_09195 [Hyphomonadaceae bacterium]